MKKFYDLFKTDGRNVVSDMIFQTGYPVFGPTGYPDQLRNNIRLPEGRMAISNVEGRNILIIGHGLEQDVSVVAEHHSKKGLLISVLNKNVAAFLLQKTVTVNTEEQLEQIIDFKWSDIHDKEKHKKMLSGFMVEMYPAADPVVKYWVSRYAPDLSDKFEAEYIMSADRIIVNNP